MKALAINDINSWALSFAFFIKVLVGFYFLYVYSSVYGNGSLSADAGAFMKESLILNNVFFQSPSDYFKLLFGIGDQQSLMLNYLQETTHWDAGAQAVISDNRNILRVQSLIQFLSFNNPIIHIFVSCFISTIAIRHLFIALKNNTLLNSTFLFFLLLFFPSLLFWSAGILKEPFMIFGFSLLIRSLFSKDIKQKKITLGVIGSFIILAFKPYVLIVMLPILLYYFIFRFITKEKIIASLLIFILIIGGVLAISSLQREKAVHLLSRKQFDFKNVGKGGLHALNNDVFYFFQQDQLGNLLVKGDSVLLLKKTNALILQHGSMEKPIPIILEPTGQKWFVYFKNMKSDGFIDVTLINDSFSQLIKNIPEALINCLFRPYLWDNGSWLKYPAVLEIFFIFSFLIYAIFNRRKLSKKEVVTILCIVMFILFLALIIGWVTPVLGAIVRYRIPVYLGILIVSILIVNPYRTSKNDLSKHQLLH